MNTVIEELYRTGNTGDEELTLLIEGMYQDSLLFERADETKKKYYGSDVFVRGLIEISSYCRNNCFYCGIRCGNTRAERYRLSPEQILSCCRTGYELGLRTFVLQGGEDPGFTDRMTCETVWQIKNAYPDCAVTLSLGEKPDEIYRSFRDAGADRYLLRHETADASHYSRLHPESMSPDNRKRCLFSLKNLGFQVGSGFMVGTPYQTTGNIVSDIRFLQELRPEMIGIGPFIHHRDTPFGDFPDGSAELTIRLTAVLRLMFPDALIPATTALGTALPDGRERGLKAGANVVMPNLSPSDVRTKYSLYENKICTGEESAECLACLKRRIEGAGCRMSLSRGDHYHYSIKTGVI